MDNKIRLFGKKTKGDWLRIRQNILSDSNCIDNWVQATGLLKFRLETRYFKPIERILNMRISTGEGFSVIALICSLIEFLQSIYEGKNYCYGQTTETDFIYGKSKDKFIAFLINQLPFKNTFCKTYVPKHHKIKTFADDFYFNVRCGLLHEATTKNGWVIKTQIKSKPTTGYIDISDNSNKIIYRDLFFETIKKYCDDYINLIKSDGKSYNNKSLRHNFCRKLDRLCDMGNDSSVDWWK